MEIRKMPRRQEFWREDRALSGMRDNLGSACWPVSPTMLQKPAAESLHAHGWRIARNTAGFARQLSPPLLPPLAHKLVGYAGAGLPIQFPQVFAVANC